MQLSYLMEIIWNILYMIYLKFRFFTVFISLGGEYSTPPKINEKKFLGDLKDLHFIKDQELDEIIGKNKQ